MKHKGLVEEVIAEQNYVGQQFIHAIASYGCVLQLRNIIDMCVTQKSSKNRQCLKVHDTVPFHCSYFMASFYLFIPWSCFNFFIVLWHSHWYLLDLQNSIWASEGTALFFMCIPVENQMMVGSYMLFILLISFMPSTSHDIFMECSVNIFILCVAICYQSMNIFFFIISA